MCHPKSHRLPRAACFNRTQGHHGIWVNSYVEKIQKCMQCVEIIKVADLLGQDS